MAKYYISLSLFLGAAADNLVAQSESIQLDRPDQTECPFIVPANFIQIENGFNVENTTFSSQSFSYPSTLWKYGLSEKSELRIITEFVSETISDSTTTRANTGLLPITLGFKTNICKEKGIIPITSFIGHLTTPDLGSSGFRTTYIAPAFRFTMQHTLSERVTLAYNLGAEWDGETSVPTGIYTLTTGITITEKLGGYLEIYGFAPINSDADHRFDCGLTYLINNNFIFDLSGGLGITDNAPDNYLSLGISYRFNTIN